jgi:uncharacterized protein YfaS (alpha-2-macroglobulin family)
MEFRKIFLIAVLGFISIAGAYSIYKIQSKKRMPFVQSGPATYTKDWEKVNALAGKGLNKSALEMVNTIYKKAKSENNAAQLVKAIIHRIKFEQMIEENADVKAIDEIKEELKTATYPLKPILHSILAELYWGYYQSNRWKFQQRSTLANVNEADITTWDLKTIFSKTLENYQASLQNKEKLKQTAINFYDEILIPQKDTRKFRPTLFDFLAHRAIDFYRNEEAGLIKPAYKFELNAPSYFSPYTDFSKLSISSKDSLSSSFYAIKLFQELLTFHSDGAREKPQPLVLVDLERLKFIKEKSILENRDSLYLQALQNLEKQFEGDPVTAEINYEIAQEYANKGNTFHAPEAEENKWMKKKAFEICEAVIKKFPGSDGAKNCQTLEEQLKEHFLQVITEKIASPDKPSLARLTYKNLKKAYARIVQPPKQEGAQDGPALYGEELLKYYLKFPAVKEWSFDLPDDGDYHSHATEIKIPELPVGSYIVLIGSNKDFSVRANGVAYAPLSVSGISYVIRQLTNGGFDCFVQHRDTGIPLRNVSAQLFYEKYDYKTQKREYNSSEKYVTNDDGFFRILPSKEYRNVRIDFTYNASTSPKNTSDYLRVDNIIYQYQRDSVEKKKVPKTFFFLDRGIYRPGQTIYFKGIMISTDGENNEVLTKTKTKVNLVNVNGQEVASLNLQTNDYGTFNGSFTAPVGVLNGDMNISNESGVSYFSVEEYKRPKFEVNFLPVKGNYRLNEQVQVSGMVKAFSGASISGAQVKYRVVRNAIYPYMPFDRFKGYMPPSPQMEISNGTLTTSDTGSFLVNFKAIPDASMSKKLAPSYSFTVYADVTDINGETHSSQKYLTVGYAALNLEIDMPENVNKTVEAEFPVRILNMNAEPVPASCKMEIFRLKQPDKLYRERKWELPDQHIISKEEFEKEFPLDLYSNENDKTTWNRQDKVLDQTLDAGKTAFKIPDLKNWLPGAYVLEAHSKDAFGEDVKLIRYLTVYAPADKQIPVNETNWFVELPKKSYEPGDKAQFLLGTKENNVHVIYEVERMGILLKRDHLVLNNEQKLIELPIEEKHRGGIGVHYVFVKNNRAYTSSNVLMVPYTNKELDIQFETFRNKLLPGQQEEWKIRIKDKKGEKAVVEMVATLYDASLDQFRPNDWYFDVYAKYFMNFNWDSQSAFSTVNSDLVAIDWNNYPSPVFKTYDQLNWFGYENHGRVFVSRSVPGRYSKNQETESDAVMPSPGGAVNMISTKVAGGAVKEETFNSQAGASVQPKPQERNLGAVAARKNFSETAFFYPQLMTDADGGIIIKFTIPEATTRWKMMGLAHTTDLKIGMVNKELVTQKELMVTPNVPRFLREKDQLQLTTKLTNLSDGDMNGAAELFLYDAVTMKELSILPTTERTRKSFILSKGQNTVVGWSITVPENVEAITYKIVAKASNFTDGEEMTVPVLTNRMLVTESLPLYVNGNQTRAFHFEKLSNQNNGSTTLRNHKLTLEFTSNPAWYAVQALPYLMEYPYDCSEQIFYRFYANSLATHIANSSPKIKAVFDAWRNDKGGKSTLLSNLEKNEELKSLLLQETPWVMQAKDESERRKRVGLLFDLNKMSNELAQAIQQLKKRQTVNGSWPWFEGMPDDRYVTQYIVTGMGHLNHLKVKDVQGNGEVTEMLQSAVQYLDRQIQQDYEWILKNDKAHVNDNHLGALQIQYLYARSYFKEVQMGDKAKNAFDYYLKQAEKYWLSNSRYLQGMIALSLNRYDKKPTATAIMKSLKENSITSEEMGMYWKDNYENYYWHQAPVEAQALLIEAFDEVANDVSSVDALRVWLLRSKQTQDWKTTKATAEAVYALLLKGNDWLSTENNVEIKVGNSYVTSDQNRDETMKAEAGTGYFKTSWNEVDPSFADVVITKKDAGISWGAMYWQYFEQLDKITTSKTPLQLKKSLFIQKPTDAGVSLIPVVPGTKLKVGDKVIVRIELRSDRTMEYVHMKDMRASALEPENVLSGYQFRDGLGYYQSTKDASTNFFFGYLPKGIYVFEYPLLITHEGDFSNGITSIQCMYAPEFTSNSEGIRIHVGE